MKSIIPEILLGLCLCASCSLVKQEKSLLNIATDLREITAMLDSIISIVKTHSHYSETVNWNELQKEISDRYTLTDSLASFEEPVWYLMTSLGDFHGFINIHNKTIKDRIERERDVEYDMISLP